VKESQNPALGDLRQEDSKFEVTQGYLARSYLEKKKKTENKQKK
jgi:hypothetical protein